MAGGTANPTVRDYARLRGRAMDIAKLPSREERMEAFVQLWWDAFAATGVSWVGFYVDHPGEPDDRRMTLAARRPKPACSPIGIHGACGQSFRAEAIRLVEDVALLGAGYIACDPRDRSELVIPIYRNGTAWGVLDADSHEYACFGSVDVTGLAGILRAAGLLDRDLPIRADRLQMRSETV
jgi:putative methionine-R-sulfoxide reductase with GAF domain